MKKLALALVGCWVSSSSATHCEVFNLQGKKVCSLRLVNKQEQLQRDGLPEGIYLVQFMNEFDG